MLTQIGERARRWTAADPWTNVYGLSRTLLALGTALTLSFTGSQALFGPALGTPPAPYCDGGRRISLFCVVNGHLDLARILAVLILLLVASGWRPRITGALHWWVSFSFQASALTVDGGDQVTAVLTLLLLPVTLTDHRVWHWQPARSAASPGRAQALRLVALCALLAARVQVSGIYLHSSISKMSVAEWADGTALYYWLTDPTFGAPSWLAPVLMPLLTHGHTVTLLTWGVIVLEFALAIGLFISPQRWTTLLALGIALHSGIAAVQGLTSFALAMIAALVLYLRPLDRAFDFSWVKYIARIAARAPHSAPVHRELIRSEATPRSIAALGTARNASSS